MTKIDIISGFLGAGKTTLIKKLLSEAFAGEQVVLIENEFGEIGIDGGFLKESGIEIREMNSGCICCSLVGDFGKSLREVVDTYHPDRILIEPSGVGKLSDVIKAVQDVQSEIDAKLNSFTTVVDVTKCRIYRKNFGEFFSNQIEYAGAVILSRTDKAKPEKIEESTAILRELNPKAPFITTPLEQLAGSKILETMESVRSMEEELLAEVVCPECGHHHGAHHHDHGEDEHHHEHHHHDHDDHDHDEAVHADDDDHDHDAEDHDHTDDEHDDDADYEIEYDEHIWTSPVNAMKITQVITDTLQEMDPADADIFAANAEDYLGKLENLDQEFRDVVNGADLDLIVMADKFPLRYFADTYGLRYRAAFSGCASDTEPSAKTIAYLIDKVREEQIPAVYYLELSSHRVAEIISEETGAKPLLFHSCHNVTRREFDNGVTYLELMEQNVVNLREGLYR